MELKVLNIKGKETGRKVKLSPEVFGIEPNDHAIYLDVKSHLANKRQGTHKTKELQKKNKRTKIEVQRFKGLGEMNASQLRETTMLPGARRLVQLTVKNGDKSSLIWILNG